MYCPFRFLTRHRSTSNRLRALSVHLIWTHNFPPACEAPVKRSYTYLSKTARCELSINQSSHLPILPFANHFTTSCSTMTPHSINSYTLLCTSHSTRKSYNTIRAHTPPEITQHSTTPHVHRSHTPLWPHTSFAISHHQCRYLTHDQLHIFPRLTTRFHNTRYTVRSTMY